MTPTAWEAKSAARAAFEEVARRVANIVRGSIRNDRVTLVLLGLATGPGRSAPRRRVARPSSAPVVSVRAVNGSRVTILLRNTNPPSPARDERRRGDGASLHVRRRAIPGGAEDWKHHGGSSRGIKTIDFGALHAPGTRVWITARWSNRRAEVGPRATPVMTFLGYCGAVKAA